MEISSLISILDITDWRRQQDETHPTYATLSNVTHNIYSITPHGLGLEASFSLERGVIGWRQSKTIGETVRENVVVRQFARPNHGILAGDDPALEITKAENNSERKTEEEDMTLRRMTNVPDFLEIWQGSQNLSAIQKESRA